MIRGACYGVLALVTLLVASVLPGTAWADPIGPDCDTCQGLIVTLTFDTITTNPDGTTTTNVTLEIDASLIEDGDTLFEASIRDVGVKVASNDSDYASTPTLTADPGGTWTTSIGGLNANGCADQSEAGFICSEDGDVAVIPGIYTWTWSVTLVSGASFLDGDGEASVKARFCDTGTDCQGNNRVGDLLSEGITLQGGNGGGVQGGDNGGGVQGGDVPAPATLLLLGTGLVGLAAGQAFVRMRRR